MSEARSNIDFLKFIDNREDTRSTGEASSSFGKETVASGEFAQAIGRKTEAAGRASYASGNLSKAVAPCSSAQGHGAKAIRSHQSAFAGGFFNEIGDAQFSKICIKFSLTPEEPKDLIPLLELEQNRMYNILCKGIYISDDNNGDKFEIEFNYCNYFLKNIQDSMNFRHDIEYVIHFEKSTKVLLYIEILEIK